MAEDINNTNTNETNEAQEQETYTKEELLALIQSESDRRVSMFT